MQSVFAALKTEHVYQARYCTRAEAKAAVFDYIEIFHNPQRLHSGVVYRTPAEARASIAGITMQQGSPRPSRPSRTAPVPLRIRGGSKGLGESLPVKT